MGYFDDMKVMLGRGMNAADRKTQELRLQAELSRVGSNLESAYASLGRVVYSHPSLASQAQSECPGEYDGITALLKDEQSIRSRIEGLQRQAAAASPASAPRQQHQLSCPKCGMPVTLDLSYCPNCGDNLADLKQGYRQCPSCGTYHTADSMFCMQCGSKTVDIPIAPQVSMQPSAPDPDIEPIVGQDDSVAWTSEPDNKMAETLEGAAAQPMEQAATWTPEMELVEVADDTPRCPNCGSVVAVDDVFCGECGTRLNG